MNHLRIVPLHDFSDGAWGITILPKLSIMKRVYFIHEVVFEIHFEWLFWGFLFGWVLKEDVK